MAHLASIKPDDYHSYVSCTLGNRPCRALVDSGNLFRNVISENFFLSLGFTQKDLNPMQVATIASARSDAPLEVLGEAPPLTLRFPKVKNTFSTRPVVLKGLSHDVNISGPFLHRHRIDQIHSNGCLYIEGVKVPMTSRHAPHCNALKPAATVQEPAVLSLRHDVIVPPGQAVEASLVADRPIKTEEILVVGDAAAVCKPLWRRGIADDRYPVLPNSSVLVAKDPTAESKANGRKRAAVHPATMAGSSSFPTLKAQLLNLTDKPVKLFAGTRYGQGAPYHEASRASVSTLDSSTSAAPPTLQDSKAREEKLKNVLQTLDLHNNKILKANRPILKQVVALVNKYLDAFASHPHEYGTTDLLEHEIRLKPGARPIKAKYRPLNPVVAAEVRSQIKSWYNQGIIEYTSSPWSSRLVVARKKNGGLRLCVDFRALNNQSIPDGGHIGDMKENLRALSGNCYYSSLDGSGAFHSIKIKQSDRHKTAFASPMGSFQFKRLPFGLQGAPATYSRLNSMLLGHVDPNKALAFLDDILIFSRTLEEHLLTFEEILLAHKKAGLLLQPAKCSLFRDKLCYLGHIVSKEGISCDPEYLQIVSKWPAPANRSEIRTFLGKVGYYRAHIYAFAKLAGPLMALLQKDGSLDKDPIKLNEIQLSSFKALKKALLSNQVLGHADFSPTATPFLLDTDWSQSNRAVSGVLSQVQNGRERVLAFASKRLSESQARYAPTKGELCAIILMIEKFKYFLMHRRFVLRTDHKAHLAMQTTMHPPTGMISRWFSILGDYDFQVIYRKSKEHGNADALSRATHIPAADGSTDVSNGESDTCAALPSPHHLVALLHAVLRPSLRPWTVEDWKEAQESDEDISWIRRYLLKGQCPEKQERQFRSAEATYYAQIFQSLCIDPHGLVCLRKPADHMSERPERLLRLVPNDWRRMAMLKAHHSASHQGVERTVDYCSRYLHFRGMRELAEDTIRSCMQCQAADAPPKDQRFHHHSQRQGRIWERLSIDLVGPLPSAKGGFKHILTVKDVFSGWVEALPMRKTDSESIAEKLVNEVFARYGIPAEIKSDNGANLTSALMRDIANMLGIEHITTLTYNPRANPVERFHQDLKAALKKMVIDHPRTWIDHLPMVLLAFRTSKSRSTGYAPFQLMFGRNPSLPLELLYGSPLPEATKYSSQQDYALAVKNRAETAFRYARNHLRMAIARARQNYTGRTCKFKVGDKVWLFCPRKISAYKQKLVSYWSGPWEIQKQINEIVYELLPHPSWVHKTPVMVTVDRLKAFHASELQPGATRPPESGADLSLQGDEFAEYDVEGEPLGDDSDPPPNDPPLPELPEHDPVLPQPDLPPAQPRTPVAPQQFQFPLLADRRVDTPNENFHTPPEEAVAQQPRAHQDRRARERMEARQFVGRDLDDTPRTRPKAGRTTPKQTARAWIARTSRQASPATDSD